MAVKGRSDDSQKAKHGGNRAGDHNSNSGDQKRRSSQAAGKDPHRGKG